MLLNCTHFLVDSILSLGVCSFFVICVVSVYFNVIDENLWVLFYHYSYLQHIQSVSEVLTDLDFFVNNNNFQNVDKTYDSRG